MPCFRPMTAWRGDFTSSGKRAVVFKASQSPGGLSAFPHKLPCGSCIGCRLDYSYDWAVRCTCEAQMHEQNCLILLTYKDLPKDGSLQLNDWQNFMDRLRYKVGPVRYFHSGEYGSRNGRPHDHALLFGFDFPDKKYFKKSAAGFDLYRSEMLEGLWEKGHCSVGSMSFESAGYLARYLMDKPQLTERIVDENGIVLGRRYTQEAIERYGEKVCERTGEIRLCRRPEYLTMSRRPGIGKSWFDKFWMDVYPQDVMVLKSGKKMPPPRFFDVEYAKKNPLDMERIKLHRIARCDKKEEVWNKFLEKYQLLDANRDDRLAVMEVVKKAQVSLYGSERGDYL